MQGYRRELVLVLMGVTNAENVAAGDIGKTNVRPHTPWDKDEDEDG